MKQVKIKKEKRPFIIMSQTIVGINTGFVMPSTKEFYWISEKRDIVKSPSALIELFLTLNKDSQAEENFFVKPNILKKIDNSKIYLIKQFVTEIEKEKGINSLAILSEIICSFENTEPAVVEAVLCNEKRPEPNEIFFLFPYNSKDIKK